MSGQEEKKRKERGVNGSASAGTRALKNARGQKLFKNHGGVGGKSLKKTGTSVSHLTEPSYCKRHNNQFLGPDGPSNGLGRGGKKNQ